jgi:hypothetical protein
MADRGMARQRSIHGRSAGEMVADEAKAALGIEAPAVEGDDAGGFLSAVLQRVQAERGDCGGLGMAENAENAAFLAQTVAARSKSSSSNASLAAHPESSSTLATARPVPTIVRTRT